MTLRSTILAAAAVAATLLNLGAVAPAFAQSPETVAVSYADLNLANPVGREALDRRIADAASELCGAFNPVELGRAAAGRACLSETIASVQPQRDAALAHRYGTVQVSQAEQVVRVSRAAI
jgi:UrcA family protein